MYRDFGTIFVFIFIGILLIYIPLLIQKLLAPNNPNPDKQATYECGEESEGSAWVQFNIRFYVVALIFLIFDVEVVFLFPWAIVFIQQGLSKFPVTLDDAEAFGLPYLVWWVVAYGETGAGIGLLVGGLFAAKLVSISFIPEFGDMLTRFSGITICSITTGIIWVSQPESLLDVILYDNLHVFFWVCGLYFALRGNRT